MKLTPFSVQLGVRFPVWEEDQGRQGKSGQLNTTTLQDE